jgi:Dynein heavy chain, N-terminal region 2
MQGEVSALAASLRAVGAALDEYTALQRAWMHLEPIFKAHDIQRQLPVEAKKFAAVDAALKKVVRGVADRPNVMHCFSDAGLLATLQESNAAMEAIQVCARASCTLYALHGCTLLLNV